MNYKKFYIYIGIIYFISLIVLPFYSGEPISLLDFFTRGMNESDLFIFWNLRIPRLILASIVGGGLAVAGLMYQSLLQNDLASPYTLGVASGASLGAVIGINLFHSQLLISQIGILGFAFIGANFTIFLVYGLSKRFGKMHSNFLILGGVAISYFFSAIISTIFYFSDYTDTFQMIRWMMGGLEIIGYDVFWVLIPGTIIAIIILLIQIKSLNIISASEELAMSKGVNINRVQKIVFLTSSLFTALLVSYSGPIAFVGLVAPHVARIVLGPNLNRLLAFTFLIGGLFLMIADSITRNLFYPQDFPVGIFTGILGGPFFLWLIFKKRNG